MADTLELINRARSALNTDPKTAYDALTPSAESGPDREKHIHPILMALSGADVDGDGTRAFLAAEPRWSAFLSAVARDASIHNDFRVRALALLSRTGAPEPRELILDFTTHTDFEDLAEILHAYDDPTLLESFVAKLSKPHQKALAMFIDLPKPPKPTATPKKSPPKPIPKKKPAKHR